MKKMDLVKIVALGAVALGVGYCSTAEHWSRDRYEVKVTSTEVKRDGDEDRYLVFTTDVETGEERVFENIDSTLEFKWDSSNIQAKLKGADKNDKTCTIDTYGWRMPFFSSYQNITDVNCK